MLLRSSRRFWKAWRLQKGCFKFLQLNCIDRLNLPFINTTEHRRFCSFSVPRPSLDLEYLCNIQNQEEINNNIKCRKGVGNIKKVQELYQEIKSASCEKRRAALEKEFYKEAFAIPNRSHPRAQQLMEEPHVVKTVGVKPQPVWHYKQFHQLVQKFGLLRTEHLSNLTGTRSYFLQGALAELENAFVSNTMAQLLKRNFIPVSVPDILHSAILEGCGMTINEDRTQIYTFDPIHYGEMCLSGTAEMSLAALFANKTLKLEELPLKVASISRCFRAEVSTDVEEKGIFRVHQFTKVEMFGLTANENRQESDMLLEEFLTIQEELFTNLGLHFQVLDMPLHELGAAAYRKYDIEAWMPGRKMFGEISSCSNCTDFQSRRLNIKYLANGSEKFVHSVNGTACAVPRMLIAVLETFQQQDGCICIPVVLQPYFSGSELTDKNANAARVKWIKYKSQMQSM